MLRADRADALAIDGADDSAQRSRRRHRSTRRMPARPRLAADVRVRQCGAAGGGGPAREAPALANAGRRCDASLRARWQSCASLSAATASAARRSRLCSPADCERPSSKASAATIRRPRRSTPNGQGMPYATYGFAAQIAEVEVDTALGTTKVLHIVAAHDVGRAINPTLGRRPDPRRHRAGPRPRADGGVHPRPHREPARLPDPDRRRHAADQTYLIEDPEPRRAVRRQGRRRAGADRHRAGDPRAPSATRPA